jgi:hypothetical protein
MIAQKGGEGGIDREEDEQGVFELFRLKMPKTVRREGWRRLI